LGTHDGVGLDRRLIQSGQVPEPERTSRAKLKARNPWNVSAPKATKRKMKSIRTYRFHLTGSVNNERPFGMVASKVPA
jgi:hypothetical protein